MIRYRPSMLTTLLFFLIKSVPTNYSSLMGLCLRNNRCTKFQHLGPKKITNKRETAWLFVSFGPSPCPFVYRGLQAFRKVHSDLPIPSFLEGNHPKLTNLLPDPPPPSQFLFSATNQMRCQFRPVFRNLGMLGLLSDPTSHQVSLSGPASSIVGHRLSIPHIYLYVEKNGEWGYPTFLFLLPRSFPQLAASSPPCHLRSNA